jgi:signal recognition particle subunit SRP72
LLAAQPQLVQANAQLAFHFAYALYRDKQHTRAIEELRRRSAGSSAGLSDGELHLQAQALYRAGQYAAAAKVYRDTHLAEDDDVELQANLLAALVSAGQLDEARAFLAKHHVLTDPASYELAYNAACGLVESGDFKNALASVRRAQTLCREVLEADEASEADVERELAGLRVQEAFILQQLSRLPGADGSENEQALALYTLVLSKTDKASTDPNAAAIASNNVITLRRGADQLWDSLKKSQRANLLDLKDMTLSARQKSAIQLNRALVLLHGKQYDKCRDVLAQLAREYPSNVQIALAQAAVLSRDKTKLREAEESLRDWLRANEAAAGPEAAQNVHLGLAHLALLRGDAGAAANTLAALLKGKGGGSMQHRPASVATLVALYERANDVEAAHNVIQQALAHWAPLSKKDPAAARLLQRLLSSAGDFYTRHGREGDAAQLLELLAAETQAGASAASRAESVARLVLAYGRDADKQAAYIAQLPALSVPESLDVATLEATPAPELARRVTRKGAQKKQQAASASASAAAAAGGEDTDTDGEDGDEKEVGGVSASMAKAASRTAAKAKAKAKKALRKPKRFPKGFDPANPGPMPDPERWLPRWERSNQKKYGRKKQQGNAIRGAQGSTNLAQGAQKEDLTQQGVESRGQMSSAAAAAARKRAGKKKGDKADK